MPKGLILSAQRCNRFAPIIPAHHVAPKFPALRLLNRRNVCASALPTSRHHERIRCKHFWREPPDKEKYNDQSNDVLTNLYRIETKEDLRIRDIIEDFKSIQTTATNCYSYSTSKIDSSVNGHAVHFDSSIVSPVALDQASAVLPYVESFIFNDDTAI